jgi:formylglycine-generating enzyme required for sulfatase activity/energy-coupling factor transporter ATP-binding protein EcfA2
MTTCMADRSSTQYDVFLSYHWRDREPVERIARSLRDRGLKPFLDRWYLVPGRPWPQALEHALASCRAVAVCIGHGEMGPWQTRESNFALDRQGRHADVPVIPVLLPGSDPVLGFLGQNTWVDLRQGIEDPLLLSLLDGAIRGEAPGPDLAERIRLTRASICPYRGLLYFREEDAPFFFGREAAIRNLHEAIRQHRFIAVVGASGSGKSSVVRAGLVPQLRQEQDTTWDVATLFPGDDPLKALARAVSPLLEPDTMDETDRLWKINKLANALEKHDVSLHDVGLRILEKQSGTNRLLLLIDQAEELYTVAKDDQTRRRFIDELLDASARGSWTAMLTLRGDFVGKALSYRPLSDRLQGAQVNVGPMTRAELEQAITSPARRVELSFADGLVTRILDDVGDEPGHLPLLEFVLKRLWEDRQGPKLSHQAYDAMGGLQGAVATKAEEVFGKLTSLEQDAVKGVFLQVVRAGEAGEDTRRRAALSDIGSAARDVIKKLADARLLVTNRAVAGEETVEVSHEALIRQWQRLQGWLNEDREFLLWRERLRGRVNEWQHNTHDEGTLLRGALLVEAQHWLSQKADMLTDEEKNYIRHSAEARERAVQAEQQRAEQELAQVKRLAEEAAKREDAERARAAAAEQARQAAEEARQAEQARAHEAERAREAELRRTEAAEQAQQAAEEARQAEQARAHEAERAREAAERASQRQRLFSLALLILLLAGLIEAWLWQKGYNVDQAGLKVRSLFVNIHIDPKQMGWMKKIDGGSFSQGDVHPVKIKSFAMGIHEVTFDEYDRYAISEGKPLPNDQTWGRGRRPVINVSWGDAKDYADWLSKKTEKTGLRYRLPTESEWEYAARSGAKQEVWAGTSKEFQLGEYAVFFDNSQNRTAEVGGKEKNNFGLYDLSGNVWEWVEDCWHGNYNDAPIDGSAWLEANGGDCSQRVIRGGSWDFKPLDLRASYRNWNTTDFRNLNLGFRLVQDLGP